MPRRISAALLLCLSAALPLAWAEEGADAGSAGGEAVNVSLEPLELALPPLKLKPSHLGLPPGSWVRVSVRATLAPEGDVKTAEASAAEVLTVHRGELVPSEMLALEDSLASSLEEAAAQAVRESRLRPRGGKGAGTELPLAGRIDLIWRIPPKKSREPVPFLEPGKICRAALRSGGLWTCSGEESELVLLFLGPATVHELRIEGELDEAGKRASLGLPREPEALGEEIGIAFFEEIPGDVLEPGKGVGVREAELEPGMQRPPELPRGIREDYAVEGDVDLLLVIDEKGTLSGIRVRRGVPGFPEVAEAACRWLAGAELRPARYQGTAYKSLLRVRLPLRPSTPPLGGSEGH